MDDLLALIVKTYGLAGLIMLSPFVAVFFLAKHIINQTKEIARINEQRVADAKAISDKLMTIVSEQSGLNKETNMALERVGDMMSVLSQSR